MLIFGKKCNFFVKILIFLPKNLEKWKNTRTFVTEKFLRHIGRL